ncbi:MAG: phosphoribosyltransferase [archaeon]
MNKPKKEQSNKILLKDLQLKVLSWNQIYGSLIELATLIKNSNFLPDSIIGVSRGGWVPARIFSDLLENSNLYSVATKFYTGVNETKQEPTITQELSGSVDHKKVLLVDDLVDSGKSLQLVISYLHSKGASAVKTATLYRKPWSVVVPDYCFEETKAWVVFPWDQTETIRNVFEKFKTSGNTVTEIKEKLISVGLNKKIIDQTYGEMH